MKFNTRKNSLACITEELEQFPSGADDFFWHDPELDKEGKMYYWRVTYQEELGTCVTACSNE